MTYKPTRAEQLRAACPVDDPAAALEVVRAYLDERGEVSALVVYELCFKLRDPEAFDAEVTRVRAEWFRGRGQEPPPQPEDPDLE